MSIYGDNYYLTEGVFDLKKKNSLLIKDKQLANIAKNIFNKYQDELKTKLGDKSDLFFFDSYYNDIQYYITSSKKYRKLIGNNKDTIIVSICRLNNYKFFKDNTGLSVKEFLKKYNINPDDFEPNSNTYTGNIIDIPINKEFPKLDSNLCKTINNINNLCKSLNNGKLYYVQPVDSSDIEEYYDEYWYIDNGNKSPEYKFYSIQWTLRINLKEIQNHKEELNDILQGNGNRS